MLIDEWQRLPQMWDLVRRAVDDGAPPGSFLLTGSALPDPPPTHSGAGRIVSLRMRPLALSERLGGERQPRRAAQRHARRRHGDDRRHADRLHRRDPGLRASGAAAALRTRPAPASSRATWTASSTAISPMTPASSSATPPRCGAGWPPMRRLRRRPRRSRRFATPRVPAMSTSPPGTPRRPTATRSRASGCSTRCRRGYRATTASRARAGAQASARRPGAGRAAARCPSVDAAGRPSAGPAVAA